MPDEAEPVSGRDISWIKAIFMQMGLILVFI